MSLERGDPETGCGIMVICGLAVVLMAVVTLMVWLGAY